MSINEYCEFKNESTCPLQPNNLRLVFSGDTSFFEGVGGIALEATPTLDTFSGPWDIDSGSVFQINIKTKDGKREKWMRIEFLNNILYPILHAAKGAHTAK